MLKTIGSARLMMALGKLDKTDILLIHLLRSLKKLADRYYETRHCVVCDKPFFVGKSAHRSTRIFCSGACRSKDYRHRKKAGLIDISPELEGSKK